ncbi:MAG: ATP-binding cassette domain-containing protein [Actinomycetota bacterium]|nr:ATP-binding cassette domain-containing protein [Actinomycetota bacterium]
MGFRVTSSGRSKLLRAPYGLDEISNGKIYIDRKLCHIKHTGHVRKLGFGMIPRERKEEGIFKIRNVKENITISKIEKLSGIFGFIKNTMENKTVGIVKRLRIKDPNLLSTVGYLSGGNQQKVVFGRWFAAKPSVSL